MNIEKKQFEDLNFENQCQLIRSANFSDKADLINRLENPSLFIENLNCEDYFLVYNSATTDIQPEILSYATPNQLVFCADFECWERDQIDHRALLLYMDKLLDSQSDIFYRWLIESDFEFIVSGFFNCVEVIKTEHLEVIDEYIGDRPFTTLDQLYYFCIEGEQTEVVEKAIRLLFDRNKTMYMTLMECLICESEAQIMEEAFDLRTKRLSFFGFPEKDEAFRIFKPIEDWAKVQEKEDSSLIVKESLMESDPLLHPVSVDQSKNLFLDQVLELYYEKHHDDHDVSSQFVNLANKFIICMDMNFSDAEILKEALVKVKKNVSMSLEDLAHSKLQLGVFILEQYYIEDIHRFGITRLKNLKNLAHKVLKGAHFKDFNQFHQFLNPPLQYDVMGLTQFYPLKAKKTADFEVQEFEEFENLNQVEQMYQKIRELKQMMEYMVHHLGENWDDMLSLDVDFHLYSLLATLCVHLELDQKASFEPLTNLQVKSFIQSAFQDQGSNLKRLKDSIKRHLAAEVFHDQNKDQSMILDNLFIVMEDEMGGIDLNYEIDLQMIPCLMTKS